MSLQFEPLDVLRLQVQDGWPDLPNLVLNPTAAYGWGWVLTDGAQGAPTGTLSITPPRPAATEKITIPLTGTGIESRGAVHVTGAAPGGTLVVERRAYDAAGALLGTTTNNLNGTNPATHELPAAAVPVGAVAVDVRFSTVAGGIGITDVVLMVGTSSAIAASDPFTEPDWTDILGPTTEIEVERDELQVGTVSAIVFDAALDPATDDLIRPGKRVRLQVLDGGTWENIITGLIADPSATYDLKTPGKTDNKRTRIELLATDNVTPLANAPRPQSVATLAELPAVLLGTGVPYRVNGTVAAVDPDAVAVVAVNDNASAVDQVAMTRDTVHGYAWVDRDGTLQLWDADELPTATAISLDEDDYADLDIDWNLSRVINVVHVVVQAINPGTGDTEETTFGPYEAPDSIREWGRRAARFTVVGAMNDTTAQAFADDVFAANATPTVRINSCKIPIRTLTELGAKATLDLYDRVLLSNTRAGISNQPARITSIKHTISTRNRGQWLVELGFAADGSVAQPQVIPGVPLGNTKNRVGEVAIFICAKADIPDGWLALDGSTFDEERFPILFDRLGSNVLPDFTDRFPIGAGTKALLTQGGASTVTIVAQTHLPLSDGTGGAGSRVPRGSTVNTKDAEPLDIMNPWVSVWFAVRAAGSAFSQEISGGGSGGGPPWQSPYFRPEDYDSEGDGVADDAAAVQAALDAAADAGGGTVLLSAVYGWTGVLQVKDYVSVIGLGGNGGGSTLKALDATAQLRFGDWATSQERIGPSGGFTVDGDGTGHPDGLVWFECVTSHFQAIRIDSPGGKGMVVHGAQNNTFIAVDILTPGDDALTHDYGSGGNIHIRCELHGSAGRALRVTRADASGVYPFVNAHNVFKHCIFETAVDGVSLVDVEAANVTRFEDCGISQNASAVMSSGYLFRVLDNPAYPSTPGFTACELVACQFYGGATGGGETDAVYVEGLNQIRVSGHCYFQNTPNEFSIDNVATVEVDGVVQSVPSTQTRYNLLTGGATNGIATFRGQPIAIKPKLSNLAALMIGRHDESGYRGWISRDLAFAWGSGSSFVPALATLGYDTTDGQLEVTGGLMQAGRRGHVRQTYAPAGGANVVCDTKAASFHAISLLNNAGTISLTNATNDAEVTVAVAQDAVGGRTITWPTAKYAGGSPPSNTTPNSLTSVTFHYFAGAGWYEIGRAVGVV